MPSVFIGKAVDCAEADGRADAPPGVVVPLGPVGVVVPARVVGEVEAFAALVAVADGAALALADGSGVSVGGGEVGVASPPPHAARKAPGTAAVSISCNQRRRPNTCMLRSAPCVNQTLRARSLGRLAQAAEFYHAGGAGSTFIVNPTSVTTVGAA
jgi:hypothetical protein